MPPITMEVAVVRYSPPVAKGAPKGRAIDASVCSMCVIACFLNMFRTKICFLPAWRDVHTARGEIGAVGTPSNAN